VSRCVLQPRRVFQSVTCPKSVRLRLPGLLVVGGWGAGGLPGPRPPPLTTQHTTTVLPKTTCTLPSPKTQLNSRCQIKSSVRGLYPVCDSWLLFISRVSVRVGESAEWQPAAPGIAPNAP